MESPPSPPEFEFDVFLSFRGYDTRHNFTAHLQKALCQIGIDSFIDDKLRRGDDLNALFDRIEKSRIAIVILSKNYANSVWCLKELVKILECRDKNKQLVIPIFYKLENKYKKLRKESFRRVTEDDVSSWEAALATTAKISGYIVNTRSPEAKLVDDIALEILKKLNHLTPSVNESLVGVEWRVEMLEKLLCCDELGSVLVVGITGMAGIGKSTLADCLYQRIRSQFDGSCFLSNIRENSVRSGLESLLEKLLSTVLNERDLEMGPPGTAHQKFERRLKSKKLLIVLDDVSHETQFRYLLGHRKWYQAGSKFIITTRDCKLIETVQGKNFLLPKLNDGKALKLFCLNAFNASCPSKDFESLTNKVLEYAKGHPLALKVLGSDLCERDIVYWKAKLHALKSKSDGDIHQVLETSFEELSTEQKDLFLDIACFFRGEKVDYLTSILKIHGVDVSRLIKELADKSMISLLDNRIEMHDMLQTMGKEISLKAKTRGIGDSGCESRHGIRYHRLWGSDICDLLNKRLVTDKIRGIFLDTSKQGAMRLRSDVFNGMYNLKYLKIYDSRCSRRCEVDHELQLQNGLDSLPSELAFLHWHGYPLQSLPLNFDPKNLVELKLPYCQLEEVWRDDKDAGMLKWIDLSHSVKLRKCRGLANAQYLERLNLEGCTRLRKLPSSVSRKLIYLNLSGCKRFKKFPLISDKVEVILLDGTAIKSLPESIQALRRLALLNLKNCNELNHLSSDLCKLKCLEELILSGCSKIELFPEIKEEMGLEILLLDGTSIAEMPSMIHLSNIRIFSLSGTNIENLPESFSQLHNLEWFDVTYCKLLKTLPTLPQNVEYMDAHECVSLETFAHPLTRERSNSRRNSVFILSNCNKLNQDAQESLVCHFRNKTLMAKRCYPEPLLGICFPATEMPSWICHQRLGQSLEFSLPPHWYEANFLGIVSSVVVSFKECDNRARRLSLSCSCKFEKPDGAVTSFDFILAGWNSEPCGMLDHGARKLNSDHVFMGFNKCIHLKKLYEESSCCYTKASFEFHAMDDETKKKVETCQVRKCGIDLVYAHGDDDSRLLKKTHRIELSLEAGQSCTYGIDDAKRGRCDFVSDDEEVDGKRRKVLDGPDGKEKAGG